MHALKLIRIGLLALALSAACAPAESGGARMEIKSPAFNQGAMIPAKYTCDGADVSPPLEFAQIPSGSQSLALICDDPDAPAGTWVHWVCYDLEPSLKGLKEGERAGVQGLNDFHKAGYGGPCPPSGLHHYHFKLYALDRRLELAPGATKAALEKAMHGHVLGATELVGTYARRR